MSCCICLESLPPEARIRWSCVAGHIYCASCLSKYVDYSLKHNDAHLPLMCSGCRAALSSRRVLLAPATWTAWIAHGLVTKKQAERVSVLTEKVLERRRTRNTVPTAGAGGFLYQDRSIKPCPKCSAPTSQFAGHGCHHVNGNNGCPMCGFRWCYRCTLAQEKCRCKKSECDEWRTCGCPICPTCAPRKPCDHCSGGKACWGCHPKTWRERIHHKFKPRDVKELQTMGASMCIGMMAGTMMVRKTNDVGLGLGAAMLVMCVSRFVLHKMFP